MRSIEPCLCGDPECRRCFPRGQQPDFDTRDREGQMNEASEEDFEKWAERYDELNGAPENEEDR